MSTSSSRWASSSRIGTALPSRRLESVISSNRPKTAKEGAPLCSSEFVSPPPPATGAGATTKKTTRGNRPSSSLIRPLSGQVFMRRTVKNGWVAKAIDSTNKGSSTIELEKEPIENDEELLGSDAGSLDSFFDDDFEDKDLGDLLSCNTLGVESKGHRPDFRSGGLAIPEFHCPRCRDHWYGLTALPCDEELARLIREGKWVLGKDGSKPNLKSDTGSRDRNYSKDMTNSGSTDSISLPSIQKRKGSAFTTNKSNHHIDFVTPGARDKSKRRITFKLNDRDDLDTDNSNSSLNDGDSQGRNRRRRSSLKTTNSNGKNSSNENGDSGTDGSGRGDDTKKYLGSGSSLSDINSGSSTTLLRGGGGGKGVGGNSGDEFDSLTSGKRSKGNRKGQNGLEGTFNGTHNSGDSNGLANGGSDSKLKNSKRVGGNIDQFGDSNNQGSSQSNTSLSNDRDSSDTNSTQHNGTNGEDMDSNGYGTNSGRQNGTGNHDGGTNDGKTGSRRGKGGSKYGSGFNSQSSSTRGSRTNLHGGDKRDRELVAGKGYMRASSPSQSDWGDPTHARIWASNTASSSRVSLAATSRRDNEEDEDERELTLPPINRKRENPFGNLDFMDGFQLTRAYTFSYH